MCPSSTISVTSPAQCAIIRHPSSQNVPDLSQLPDPGQLDALPIIREISSIPRVSGSRTPNESQLNWEYPSPQQFYNALRRKGWNFPERNIEPMVAIHNRLNEAAWAEILKWESRRNRGVDAQAARLELLEFAGIHDRLSHKARLYQLARWLFPSHFRFSPPFDRHDWVVRWPQTDHKVRYIIDYYSLRKGVDGDPEFYLDVRPAMDSLGSIRMRLVAISEDLLSDAIGFTVHFLWPALVSLYRLLNLYVLFLDVLFISVMFQSV